MSSHRSRHFPFRALVVVLLALVITWFPTSAGADPPSTRQRKANQVSKRGNGSAAAFLGNVALVELYVADDISHWNAPHRLEVDRRIESAVDFLQRHARMHQRVVRVQRIPAGEVKVAGRISTDPHTDPGWTEDVIQQATGKTSDVLVQSIREEHNADAVAICLHVDQAGISYNLAYYDRVDPVYASERMVCFRNYPDGRGTAAASYAHELLHLFGAGDLYFPFDASQDRAVEAVQWFPSDIMLRVDYDIGRLTIGPFTAFRIGWRDSLAPRWKHFED